MLYPAELRARVWLGQGGGDLDVPVSSRKPEAPRAGGTVGVSAFFGIRTEVAVKRRSVLVAAAALAGLGAGPGGLARWRWRRRVVVVFAPPGDLRAAEQGKVLGRLAAGGDDRDLVMVRVEGEGVDPPVAPAADLRREFGVAAGSFTALLVGKDGGVKLRRAAVLGADLLTQTIDAMPMRRDEVHGGRGG